MEIYLDNAATTKPFLKNSIEKHLRDAWYNPSSAYSPAAEVFRGIKEARELLKKITGLSDCVFTSGGTEANNMVVLSAYKPGAHYITSAVEHPSVYNAFKYIESLGASVDYIKPKNFCISADDVAAAVRENTVLVSIMNVNNETGALNDINSIAGAVKARNHQTLFHSDGVQALYKTNIDLSGVDYYTLSAHKIHALKGTGAVLARENSRVKKLLHGGDQEFALRPGTENTLGIQAFLEALETGRDRFADSYTMVKSLEENLIAGLTGIEGARVNLPENKVPHIVNVSFPGVRAEVLVRVLGEKGIYIGTGAACSRGKLSRVLLESGLGREYAESAVRISMSGFNTLQDIEICIQEMRNAVEKLRGFGRR